MADITSTVIKELRERTGVGMMECKKALIEAQGDIELAIDNMRKFGQARAAKKSGRVAAEGVILTQIAEDGKYGVMIELNCETDFVAKDIDFKDFGDAIIAAALNERIADVKVLKAKFEEKRLALVAKIGENINIRRSVCLEGDLLGFYLHGARIGVMVSAAFADYELVKHVAMHIAASKPQYINADDVPADVMAREHKIQLDIAMQAGKTREIAEKMIQGRMRKFIGEISLINQDFVMDPTKTVGQFLSEQNAIINKFIRFELGEGIEKEEVNFVAEVEAMRKNF